MNTIVTLPCKTIRAMARQMGKGLYWKGVALLLACQVLVNAPVVIGQALTDSDFILNLLSLTGTILQVAASLGTARCFMLAFRGYNVTVDNFTESFYLTPKGVILMVLFAAGVFLRSLLLVVPGVIYSIACSQQTYILIDNPQLRPVECLQASRAMMMGNKMKYFKLQLSFIGWHILGILPYSVYQALAGPKFPTFALQSALSLDDLVAIYDEYSYQLAAFNNTLPAIILNALTVLVMVYVYMAQVCFYDLVSGNLVVSDSTEAE